MRKTGKPIKQTTKSIPMLVNRQEQQVDETAKEFGLFIAFQNGAATVEHYDRLCDMTNLVLINNETKPSTQGGQLAESLVVITENAKARFVQYGKYGLNGQELTALGYLIKRYQDYWATQPTHRFNQALAELNAFHLEKKVQQETKQ